ncbi:DUF4112 domain-containing protein [Tropicibacter naphthalenivorans]|uniref:DUF4112 domain-containing protein n=1 Tax=Tropicibacter naphthalenivorans TaxID=441103 RepID=A0A0P1G1G9_9RHOB|nr:DUF4112 domain-containing protein [Tropicibacter naphthalenivorans]CUH75639.1 hypothetical protein TRN7648_00540 [Tropicibacter naphthalenivorans]SMC43071.1 protein of unknown function [Tropicibacter naphthalenivorans]
MPSTSLPAAEAAARLARIENLAAKLDRAYRIPGTGIRLGWDSILGLVPGVGDALALAPALWIIQQAHSLGARKRVLARMGVNTAIDSVIGSVPLLGDLFDVGFKSNQRNVALLRDELSRI